MPVAYMVQYSSFCTWEAGFSLLQAGLAVSGELCGIFTLVGHVAYGDLIQRQAAIFIQLDAVGLEQMASRSLRTLTLKKKKKRTLTLGPGSAEFGGFHDAGGGS